MILGDLHLKNKLEDDLNTVRFVVAELVDRRKVALLLKHLEAAIEDVLLSKVSAILELNHTPNETSDETRDMLNEEERNRARKKAN